MHTETIEPTSQQFLPEYTVDEFNALPSPEQRRGIARDAITQLKSRRYTARSVYFLTNFDENDEVFSLRERLLEAGTHCHVCGVGACFASAVRLSNDFNGGYDFETGECLSLWDHRSIDKLKQYFSPAQLELIEDAYERRIIQELVSPDCEIPHSTAAASQRIAASSFGRTILNGEKRMLAILERIADDPNGEFNP